MNIGVWSIVKAMVGDMEEKIREVRTRRIRLEVVVFFQVVVGKNNFVVQYEYG